MKKLLAVLAVVAVLALPHIGVPALRYAEPSQTTLSAVIEEIIQQVSAGEPTCADLLLSVARRRRILQ
jgi:hypothetical protein